jgi:hypothetical protein
MAPTSEALVQVSLDGGRDAVEALLSELRGLAAATPASEATVGEMPWDFCAGNFGATGTGGSAPRSDSTPEGGAVEHALLLGAGLVAAPAAELLSRAPNRVVTVVSSVPGEASALVKRLEGIGRTNVHAETWGRDDAANGAKGSRLYNSVGESNLVVSLLPAAMHLEVANACIANAEEGGNAPVLITASYIDGPMAALDERVRTVAVFPLACCIWPLRALALSLSLSVSPRPAALPRRVTALTKPSLRLSLFPALAPPRILSLRHSRRRRRPA